MRRALALEAEVEMLAAGALGSDVVTVQPAAPDPPAPSSVGPLPQTVGLGTLNCWVARRVRNQLPQRGP
jgi:hypothetical protein